MFDIGFSELLIIAVVALIVLGPERLPKAARFAGLWVRRARAQWNSVKDELERDLAHEELKRNLQDTRELMRQADQDLRDQGERIRHDFERMPGDPDATPPIEGPAETPSPTPSRDDDAVR
ncbi:twin-arginine translocase subunit TatB [Luteimonas gilva]|uniref:Sec-independent protein translocase protein TatB n=1 Tax=Luteimonas gilva TaxID=2572684 RepID=A0A4U5JSC2_9GAMM|nr:twin-arginine translocase subunit TatB [Luteimonas gilva]